MATILVVEDHQDIRDLLTTVLNVDYEVRQATNGSEAIAMFTEQEPDLVLLDVMLPHVTGESVLSWIRKISSVPVIVLTAIQDKTSTVEFLTKGANDYVTKPFDIDELLARIGVQLREQCPKLSDKNTTMHVGDLSIDLATYKVRMEDKEISLAKKEFALLSVLMKRPHQVFDKASLYEAVWEQPYINAENTLNVHLSNLRTKLNELVGESRYVISVWGIGVRLV
ncbi:response regulator transcription factor [Bombiscardovia coagulans]|uniref:DNA-binding response regulator n=1 Tax=Bombiscardovia coagulans TaxID=686666 RepID=A0A261ETG6_9BIFI|nr:response regulator transcription factor [Bombiscardovia coagulans]OZG50151.1 DNA-binding response regulator [Bombiscardovia coagulans]